MSRNGTLLANHHQQTLLENTTVSICQRKRRRCIEQADRESSNCDGGKKLIGFLKKISLTNTIIIASETVYVVVQRQRSTERNR